MSTLIRKEIWPLFFFALMQVTWADEKAADPKTTKPLQIEKEVGRQEQGLLILVSHLPLDHRDSKADNGWGEPSENANAFCKRDALQGESISESTSTNLNLDELENDAFEICDTSRIFGGRGNNIRVVFIDLIPSSKSCESRQFPSMEFKETTRQLLIASQFRQLLTAVTKSTAGSDKSLFSLELHKPKINVCGWEWAKFQLKKDRAEVSAEAKEPQNIKFNIVTGPPEHYFLSVDAVTKGAGHLKYNVEQKTLTLRDKPEQVYLGFNYMLGDVYSNLPRLSYRRLVIKAMVTPNQQFDSFGLGVGYRLPNTIFSTKSIDSTDHSGFVLFFGRFATRNDTANSIDSRRTYSSRIGISYSFGAALDQLFPKKE